MHLAMEHNKNNQTSFYHDNSIDIVDYWSLEQQHPHPKLNIVVLTNMYS